MVDIYEPSEFEKLMDRACPIWVLGHGAVLSGIGLTPTGEGLLIMMAVPDRFITDNASDWRKAKPGKDQFDLLLRGSGPVHITSFKKPEDVDRMIGTLLDLKVTMEERDNG